MTKEIIKLIVESPNGADMFSQWMTYKWVHLGLKVAITAGLLLLVV
jgi:hypothetical protein